MEEYMKVNGKLISVMEGDLNYILMEIFIWVNFKLERLMAKADINGYNKEKFMMVNGRRELDMVMEFGRK